MRRMRRRRASERDKKKEEKESKREKYKKLESTSCARHIRPEDWRQHAGLKLNDNVLKGFYEFIMMEHFAHLQFKIKIQ